MPPVGTNTSMTAVSEQPRLDLAGLVQEHQAQVWRRLRYLGASREEADDLTQETFLAVARSPLEQRSPAQTAAYLCRAARNQLLMVRRKQGRQVSTVDLEVAEQAWAELAPESDDQLLGLLSECYEQTTGRAREALDRFYRENANRAELAEAMNMTIDGVKTLLRRTRQSLRDCVERKRDST